MTEKDKIIFSLYNSELKFDTSFFDQNINIISKLIVDISKKLFTEKTTLKRNEDYYEVHYFKFTLQTMSLRHLFEGTPLKLINPNNNITDISSIYCLTRSLLESFLTINYLYYNPKSGEQAIFRYLLYILSGLNNRQTFPANIEENKIKKEEEKVQIQQIAEEIKANKYFTTLHIGKQNHILKRMLAYEIGMKEIIPESGLDNELFYNVWSLYSNYSHSEQIEAMQLREYIKDSKSYAGSMYGTYRLCFMLNCFQLIKMTERFPSAKETFDKQPLEIRTIVEFYYKLLLGLKLDNLRKDNSNRAASSFFD